jgi:predicted ArsR family transcriptional regulator
MPKANTNTARCRKLDIVWLLGRQHAMSAVQIAKKMRMDVSSVRRYLMELREEKKVFRRYQLRGEDAKRPTFYYCLRRDRI